MWPRLRIWGCKSGSSRILKTEIWNISTKNKSRNSVRRFLKVIYQCIYTSHLCSCNIRLLHTLTHLHIHSHLATEKYRQLNNTISLTIHYIEIKTIMLNACITNVRIKWTHRLVIYGAVTNHCIHRYHSAANPRDNLHSLMHLAHHTSACKTDDILHTNNVLPNAHVTSDVWEIKQASKLFMVDFSVSALTGVSKHKCSSELCYAR